MSDSHEESYEKVVEKMLEDPASKAWLLRKLGLDDEDEADKDQLSNDQGGPPKEPPETQLASYGHGASGNLTPSGKTAGTHPIAFPSVLVAAIPSTCKRRSSIDLRSSLLYAPFFTAVVSTSG